MRAATCDCSAVMASARRIGGVAGLSSWTSLVASGTGVEQYVSHHTFWDQHTNTTGWFGKGLEARGAMRHCSGSDTHDFTHRTVCAGGWRVHTQRDVPGHNNT